MSAPGEAVVALRQGVVGYGERPVLRGVDLALRRGEVLALLGPNGSGKSTLVRAVLGLVPLTSGTLELFGVDSGSFSQRWRIGYVPQRHTVTGGVPSTVREVVSSGRLARRRLLVPETRRDREAVRAALETVHLREKERQDVSTLSGGQQRRALIARALAAEPEVLVMDEPTAGVDAANQEILADTMARLVAAGTTILLVAHELGPLAPVVTRVVRLREGRVTYDGPAHPPQTRAGLPGPEEVHDGQDEHAHGEAPVRGGLGWAQR